MLEQMVVLVVEGVLILQPELASVLVVLEILRQHLHHKEATVAIQQRQGQITVAVAVGALLLLVPLEQAQQAAMEVLEPHLQYLDRL